jgi:hypothetical protein
LSANNNQFYHFGKGQFDLLQPIIFQGKPVGFVYILSDLGAINDRLRSYAIILLTILAASMVAALALSRISQRSISRPILSLGGHGQVCLAPERLFRARADAARAR